MTILVEKGIERFLGKRLKWVLLYFPVRYFFCGLFFAVILFNNVQYIRSIEGQILAAMLHFFGVSSFYIQNGNLYVGSNHSPSKLILYLPVFSQFIFLIFFPTVAIAARIDLKRRLKLLFFGVVCFFVFVLIQFLTIVTLLNVGLITSHSSFVQTSIFLTLLIGGLVVDSALFTTMTIPNRTKIKPIVKRSYSKEYAYFIILLGTSFLVIYFLLNILFFNMLNINNDSPFLAIVALHFNISTVTYLSYYMSYLIYGAKVPNWFRFINNKTKRQEAISFLLPAYNEERIIGRTIESIDRAASNYSGTTEIVIVNDGSTDRTSMIVNNAFCNLQHCTGKLFNIHNSGKGFALKYGLAMTTGEIIFRIDADCVIDEEAITPIIRHFDDPNVGIVSGMILPLEEKSIWQKTVNLLNMNFMMMIRRGQELVDSILVQSGGYSVFRKDALIKIGGWADNLFGEDGEITHRMGRYGYKLEYEPNSLVYGTIPEKLTDLMNQRTRWSIAFYHARGINLELVRDFREYNKPRAIIFLFALISHGIGFGQSMALPFLLASALTGIYFNVNHFNLFWLERLALLESLFYGLSLTMYIYYLHKYRRIGHLKYYPIVRLYGIIVRMLVKPVAMEVLLHWSSKWKDYNHESFEDLRKEVKRVDPGDY